MAKSAEHKLLFLISVFTSNPHEWIDVFSSPLPRLKGYPKRNKTIKEAISKLIDKKMIEYMEEGDKILIRPTSKSFELLSNIFPYYNNFLKKWDGRFRILMYDIPEAKRGQRDKLRRMVQINHLGKWQHSVWVSAWKIDSLVNKLESDGLKDKVEIFEAKFYFIEERKFVPHYSMRDFAAKIWDLGKLNDKYKQIYKKIKKSINENQTRRTKVELFRTVFIEYEKLLSVDPGLPRQLLAKNWYGDLVRGELKRLQRAL